MKKGKPALALPAYKTIRSTRKTIALIVRGDGQVVVRAPRRLSQERIQEFVTAKLDWILEKQTIFQKKREQAIKRYVEGEEFFFLGSVYPLRIEHDRMKDPLVFTGQQFCIAQVALPRAKIIFTNWYKKQAHVYFPRRVQLLADQYGLAYEHIRITSARTRWGSCSSTGTLSFPWRLVMAPPEIIDYVIVHELAHIEEKNHSARFWARVETMMPDYKRRLRWLMENGHRFSLDDVAPPA